MRPDDDPLAPIGSLQEPKRRALYDIVAAHPDGIGREEAARAAGISRSLAAYHLDRLVDDGLLQAEYRRLSGRGGPGAGRPPKIYRPSGREFQITIPPRDYELAARLLAAALERRPAGGGAAGLRPAAAPIAATIASRVRDRARARGATVAGVSDLARVLAELGYEPYQDADGELRLRNCPFHALVEDHRRLMCTLNHSLLEETVRAARLEALEAELEPREGHCCVAVRHRPTG